MESLAPQSIGFTQIGPALSTASITATGAAAPVAYPAYGFTALESGVLLSVDVLTNGTGINNVKASLYLDDGIGKPVSTGPIANSEGPAVTLVNAAVNKFYFGPASEGIAVTKGTRYHVVFKSYTSGQNPTFVYMSPGSPRTSNSHGVGYTTTTSATTADTWGSVGSGRIGVIYTMASGTTWGLLYNYSYSGAPTNTNREFGAKFQSPPVFFAADSLAIALHKNGSPVGDIVLKLYVNGAVAAVSDAFKAESLSASVGHVTMPIDRVVIPPNSICRIVWVANVGDTATNYLRSNRLVLLTGGTPTLPLGAVETESIGGAAWVDNSTRAPWFLLHGSPISDFAPVPINRRYR